MLVKKIVMVAVLASVLSNGNILYAQTADEVRNVITADSLKTGNYKDVLTSFFQLAFRNLAGPDKELRINSNPFAIMARSNPELLNGDNWYSYRHLRALNVSAGIKTDSNYRLQRFSAGLKYALINRRDLTTSRGFYSVAANSPENRNRNQLNMFLAALISAYKDDPEKQREFLAASKHLTVQSDDPWTFNELSAEAPELFGEIKTQYSALSDDEKIRYAYIQWLFDHPDESPSKAFQTYYGQLKDEWLQKPLWTVAVDGASYSDQLAFANVNVGSEFLAGILANGKRTFTGEFDLKALLAFSDDNLNPEHDLKRVTFSFEPGVNFAMRDKKENKSFLEFKLSGSYYNIVSGGRSGEKTDSVTMNAEIRLRIYDDIWVPVILKYDPEHQNLFGFLNISANFTGLSNLLGGGKKSNSEE